MKKEHSQSTKILYFVLPLRRAPPHQNDPSDNHTIYQNPFFCFHSARCCLQVQLLFITWGGPLRPYEAGSQGWCLATAGLS